MLRIGTDIVRIDRISEATERFGERFVQRYLHPQEYGDNPKTASLAGYWAAKEAVAKALGCGIGSKLGFHDIFLHKNAEGAPSFSLSPEALRRFPVRESSLSVSHDGNFAIAVAVLVLDSPISG